MSPNTTVYSVQCSVHLSVQCTLYYIINCIKAYNLLADLTQSLRNNPSLTPVNCIKHPLHSTKHYIVHFTVYYIVQWTLDILYTTLYTNPKLAGWSGLIPEEHLLAPSCTFLLNTIMYNVLYTSIKTVLYITLYTIVSTELYTDC